MVEKTVDIEFIEKLSCMDEVRLFGIMLHNILKALQKLVSGQNFGLFQYLADNVLEFVINQENSIDILGVIEDLVSDGRGFIIFIGYLLGSLMGLRHE
jgi:hypothetical protein